MRLAARTPVVSPVEVIRDTSDDDLSAATRVVVDPAEPVFEGHYPGFPILPGVCLIEYVHQSALATCPGWPGELDIEAVESARFLGAVYPGDRVDIDLTFAARPAGWQVSAKIRGDRGDVASVRLRYREGQS